MLNLKNPFTKNSKRLGDLATWNARRAELEAAAEHTSSAMSEAKERLDNCAFDLKRAQSELDF